MYNWTFARGNHQSLVVSPHNKLRWTLMSSFFLERIGLREKKNTRKIEKSLICVALVLMWHKIMCMVENRNTCTLKYDWSKSTTLFCTTQCSCLLLQWMVTALYNKWFVFVPYTQLTHGCIVGNSHQKSCDIFEHNSVRKRQDIFNQVNTPRAPVTMHY